VTMNSLDKATELKQRTKAFAIRIVNLFRSLPRSPDAQTLGTDSAIRNFG